MSFDLELFFDSERLSDCHYKLYKLGIKGKTYRLLNELNSNTKVRVKTPLGMTDSEEVDPGMTQGAVDASIVSSANVAGGIEEAFDDPEREVKFGDVQLAPLSFVDDIGKLSEDIESAQYGNDRIQVFVGSKTLSLNLQKSAFLIIGSKKQRKNIQSNMKENPITLLGQPMPQVKAIKHLGDYLTFSPEESVHQTVLKRVAIGKQSILEIRAVIEDFRAEKIGGINLAFTLFESTVANMIYFNSETWVNIQKKTIRLLNGLYNDFFTTIFRIGKGIPVPNMYRICRTLLPENEILLRKLNFTFHVANLSIGTLARDVYEVQKNKSIGLFQEVEDHINRIGNNCLNDMSKLRFRALAKRYISQKNKQDLVAMAQRYKKIDIEEFQNDSFTRKAYFQTLNLHDIRYKIRIEMKMVATIRQNYPSKYRRKNLSLSCPSCRNMSTTIDQNTINTTEKFPDNQNHLLHECRSFSHLTQELDLRKDSDLIHFFKWIVEMRMEEGDD